MTYFSILEGKKCYFLDTDRARLAFTISSDDRWTESDIIELNDEQIELGYDGAMYLKGHAPKQPLAEAKAQKLADLKSAFEQAASTAHCTSVLGFEIDANDTANRNVGALIRQLVRGDIETATFRDWNNQYHPGLTLDNLNTIQGEIDANGSRLYAVKWTYEQQIAQAQDVEALEAITFQF